MDIYCAKCGEPWDAYGVFHGDMEPDEKERFLNGEGCPCCHFGQVCPTCRDDPGPYPCPNEGCGVPRIGHVMVWDGEKIVYEVCPVCKGTGHVDVCPTCGGTGKPNRRNLERFLESVIGNVEDPDEIIFRFV